MIPIEKGVLYGAGDNKYGQLGEASNENPVVKMLSGVKEFSLGWNHTIVLTGRLCKTIFENISYTIITKKKKQEILSINIF